MSDEANPFGPLPYLYGAHATEPTWKAWNDSSGGLGWWLLILGVVFLIVGAVRLMAAQKMLGGALGASSSQAGGLGGATAGGALLS